MRFVPFSLSVLRKQYDNMMCLPREILEFTSEFINYFKEDSVKN